MYLTAITTIYYITTLTGPFCNISTRSRNQDVAERLNPKLQYHIPQMAFGARVIFGPHSLNSRHSLYSYKGKSGPAKLGA